MANNERTRAAAKAALDTYTAIPGFQTEDDLTSIGDLIADLAHLADTYEDGDGELVLDTARADYYEERGDVEYTDDDECDQCGDTLDGGNHGPYGHRFVSKLSEVVR